MNIVWQTLGIAPTSDVRAIKRAYAILLKRYRPDEYPQEFQQLNWAYQQALAWQAECSTEDPDSCNDCVVTSDAVVEKDVNAADSIEVLPALPLTDEESVLRSSLCEESSFNEQQETAQKQALYNQNVERVRQLLQGANAEITRVRSWQFLTESDYIYEYEYNLFVGIAVIRLVHNYLHSAPPNTLKSKFVAQPPKRITIEIWKYLNGIFNWQMRGNELQTRLTPSEMMLLVRADILDAQFSPLSENSSHSSVTTSQAHPSKFNWNTVVLIVFVLIFLGRIASHFSEAVKHRSPIVNPASSIPNKASDLNQLPSTVFAPNSSVGRRAIPDPSADKLSIRVFRDFVEGEIKYAKADESRITSDGVGIELLIDKDFKIFKVNIYSSTGDLLMDDLIRNQAKQWKVISEPLSINNLPEKKRLYVHMVVRPH